MFKFIKWRSTRYATHITQIINNYICIIKLNICKYYLNHNYAESLNYIILIKLIINSNLKNISFRDFRSTKILSS